MIRVGRTFRFSLRAVLIALSLVCIFLGMMARQAHRQRAAAAWVRGNGGQALYGFECRFEPVVKGALPGPDWLCRLIGIDFFASVEGVGLTGNHVSDIAVFENLPGLTTLDLEDTAVRDIASLEHLSKLASLNLKGTQVSDISPLAKLERLTWLDLSETDVRSLSPLQNLSALSYLKLNHMSSLEDAEIVKLRQSLPNCEFEVDGEWDEGHGASHFGPARR